MGLYSPFGLSVMPNGDFYVTDMNNVRVQYFRSGSRVGQTIAGNGTTGSSSTQLSQPMGIYVNSLNRNVYIGDTNNDRVQLWVNNATQGQTVIGASSVPPSNTLIGVRLDLQGRIYASQYFSSTVIRWLPDGTNGTIVAGSGSPGSDNQSLSHPYQIDLDATGEYLYIADHDNHRIQKWKQVSNGSAAATTGITVAGGNGQGVGANQLDSPNGVCVSAKTGAIYIADTSNYRIQRWAVGVSQGVTIAGGFGYGYGPTQLNLPAGVALDADEIYLYIADQANHRIQRFTLI
jgi:sugar lactone lactonase YvrE